MALPKFNYPTTLIENPSNKKKYTFRPMLVKDEKLLLMAKASEVTTDILSAIKQVVSNCVLDNDLDVDTLPLYVLEYLFIKLRAFSVGDKINVSYRDFEDNKLYEFEIDLSAVTIRAPEETYDNKVIIEGKSGIVLRYPSAHLYDDKNFLESESEDSFYKLVGKCIDQIFDEDTVYPTDDISEEELYNFVEMIDVKSFDKIREFITHIPTLYYKLEYKNSFGNAKVIELTTLSDFFTLR